MSKYIISRLEDALELQKTTDGENCATPVVGYCFECDEISVDRVAPKGCFDHSTAHSDGYEHAGIQEAIAALSYADYRDTVSRHFEEILVYIQGVGVGVMLGAAIAVTLNRALTFAFVLSISLILFTVVIRKMWGALLDG